MLDSRTILVTTTQSSRVLASLTTVMLPPGVVTHWRLTWPPGCLGMVHLALSIAGRQVIPWTSSEDLALDDWTEEIDDALPVAPGSDQLTISAWNTDRTYNHLVIVRWELRPLPPPALAPGSRGLFERLGGLIRG